MIGFRYTPCPHAVQRTGRARMCVMRARDPALCGCGATRPQARLGARARRANSVAPTQLANHAAPSVRPAITSLM